MARAADLARGELAIGNALGWSGRSDGAPASAPGRWGALASLPAPRSVPTFGTPNAHAPETIQSKPVGERQGPAWAGKRAPRGPSAHFWGWHADRRPGGSDGGAHPRNGIQLPCFDVRGSRLPHPAPLAAGCPTGQDSATGVPDWSVVRGPRALHKRAGGCDFKWAARAPQAGARTRRPSDGFLERPALAPRLTVAASRPPSRNSSNPAHRSARMPTGLRPWRATSGRPLRSSSTPRGTTPRLASRG